MSAGIRAATAGDAVAIAGLTREMAATFGESSAVEPSWVEAFLARGDAGAFVAEVDGVVVGVVTWFLFPGLYHAADCATVDEAIVTEAHRRQGIGTALLMRTMTHLEQLGVAEIGISTGLENEGAQRLYRRLGFSDPSLLLERHFGGEESGGEPEVEGGEAARDDGAQVSSEAGPGGPAGEPLPAGVEIREAGPGDEADVVRLVAEMGAGFSHGTAVDEAFVRRYLEQPGTHILLAVAPEGPVGVLSCSVTLDLYHAAPAGEIEDVAVTPAAQGRGIGEALVRDAVRRLEAAGCVEIGVITSAANRRAQGVYRRAGLTEELVCLQRHLLDDE